MANDSKTTRAHLENLNDPGSFEVLAAAVLRQAVSAYTNLIEMGTNAQGKTVVSPIDGFAFFTTENGDGLVAVHHTTTGPSKLADKWLSQTNGDLGDIAKAARWYRELPEEISKIPLTLVLTTNRKVGSDLMARVTSRAIESGIKTDVWDQSRLSDHLDNTAEGQWLRRRFQVAAERLSLSMLQNIGERSLDLSRPEIASVRVTRSIDTTLERALQDRNIVLFVGESGMGKTSSALDLLRNVLSQGGVALVLPHEHIEASVSFADAIERTLRAYEPSLADGCGAEALQIAGVNNNMVLSIEDLNRSDRPTVLLDKILRWVSAGSSSANPETKHIKLICPIWPQFLHALPDVSRKFAQRVSIYCGLFSKDEATEALRSRALSEGLQLSGIQAQQRALALGQDPLLIALYSFGPENWQAPADIISYYVNGCCARAALASTDITAHDFRNAIAEVAAFAALNRQMTITLSDIRDLGFFSNESASRIIALSKEKSVVSIENGSDEIIFRHDRVFEFIMAELFCAEMDKAAPNGFVFDPFFASVLGLALSRRSSWSRGLLDRILQESPASLIHYLKHRTASGTNADAVLRFLEDNAHKALRRPGNRNSSWILSSALASIDGPFVRSLSSKFENADRHIWEATFRNGDVDGGIALCYNMDPGVNSSHRDQLISHALDFHGEEILPALMERIEQSRPGRIREGALYLAGFIGCDVLGPAIQRAWQTREQTELGAFLWAAIRCGAKSPSRLLDPILKDWRALPSGSKNRQDSVSRDDIAAYSVRFGIAQSGIPDEVIDYLLVRAKKGRLAWPITYMLHNLDHPKVLDHMVRFAGDKWRHSFDFTFLRAWDRTELLGSSRLSTTARDYLKSIWSSKNEEDATKLRAFRIWSASSGANSLDELRAIRAGDALYETALRWRIVLGDPECFEDFQEMLRSTDQPGYWWQFTRHVWQPTFTGELKDELHRRRLHVSMHNIEWYDADWLLPELIIRLPAQDAEALLVENWDHLKGNKYYSHAALHVDSRVTRELALEAIFASGDPRDSLEHVSMHFGLNGTHGGQATPANLDGLLPVLKILGQHEIQSLWDFCNRAGYLEWRSTHLDDLLDGGDRRRMRADGDGLVQELAAEFERSPSHGYFWVEHVERWGGTSAAAFDALHSWLCVNCSIASANFAADVIVSSGTRREMSRFKNLLEQCGGEDLAADTEFALLSRSLN